MKQWRAGRLSPGYYWEGKELRCNTKEAVDNADAMRKEERRRRGMTRGQKFAIFTVLFTNAAPWLSVACGGDLDPVFLFAGWLALLLGVAAYLMEDGDGLHPEGFL